MFPVFPTSSLPPSAGTRVPRRAPQRCGPPGLVALLLLAVSASACQRRPVAEAPPPYDVVLVALDGVRADHLSLFGYPEPTSPEIEALARESITYARAVSPATWCVPAVASLSTGLWPSFHGAERAGAGEVGRARALADDATTMAELLARDGFRTAAFVGNGDELRPGLGFARGFSHFDAAPDLVRGEVLAERVADWLARHSEHSFVFASLADGGDASDPPADLASRFAPPATGASDLPAGGPSQRPTREANARRSELHDTRVAAADRALGRLVAALRAAGRWDRSLVVVVGDHGEMLGEHGLNGHGRPPYEPEVRVPLLVKTPGGRRAGEWVERRVSTLGVFATVLGAVGIAVPTAVQSRNLDELHPVWVEDVGRDGRRMRAGYDGLHAKVVALEDGDTSIACAFDLLQDPGEAHPDCRPGAAGPLDLAMRWFGQRVRPVHANAEAELPSRPGAGTDS